MAEVHRETLVTASGAGRIDRVVQALTGRSRADVRGLFDHGCVKLGGRLCDSPGTAVIAGDIVEVCCDAHRRYHPRSPERPPRGFRLVYEDHDLLVVDKPAALLTVPTARRETGTLVDLVSRYYGRSRRGVRVHVVHRLDRGTSGLLVFATSATMAGQMQDQFRVRGRDDRLPVSTDSLPAGGAAERRRSGCGPAEAIRREYLAIVAGEPNPPAGTFDSRLATGKTLSRYSTRHPQAGERAVTHYCSERMVRGATLVRVWLDTGRRNQIRVHFAEAGHPVLGDERYRPDLARHGCWAARRLALHAAMLAFRHPATGEKLRFESPLPAEFRRFLRE